MKHPICIAFVCLFSYLSMGQAVSIDKESPWKTSLRKFYLEAGAGALIIFSFGASADLGYQFHPALGLGITASGYSELDDYFPASWSGLGLHYRVAHEGLILRFDYIWNSSASKNDDRPDCGGWNKDEDKTSRYWAASIGYRFKIFKFGVSVSRANLHFYQTCDGVAEVNRFSTGPIALVPTIGLSLGGKRKTGL